ncbi:MAG: YqhA family protein [gamma proteobacterium symbiont of Lucinoma myriamae]|nr:YqhA family protein [gamma proteobacterium symbiont of Lucinoma myriamae]MCU7819880.1 YqhA family protein [gamma proteobacterium symbiont of Lucinoma myriamae]MCU7833528.1 YqhA family protein [gamma proteobacterium symbiont of Lucinoma myriamae]
MFEKLFENSLWASRFIILLAVFFGLIGAVLLFVVASVDVYETSVYVITTYLNQAHPEHFHENVVGGIIGAVDFYLIGVVMLLFAFGLYELFISDIDAAKDEEGRDSKILAIHSLDQLKDKISKVIVMVLVVGFFQKVAHTQYNGALDMLYFALSITAVSVGLFFLGKVGKH